MKAQVTVVREHATDHERMDIDIQIQGAADALNNGDGPAPPFATPSPRTRTQKPEDGTRVHAKSPPDTDRDPTGAAHKWQFLLVHLGPSIAIPAIRELTDDGGSRFALGSPFARDITLRARCGTV